jgi:hypothetical protein
MKYAQNEKIGKPNNAKVKGLLEQQNSTAST